MSVSPTMALIAGEASGDQLGAGLIAAAQRLRPDLQFVGIAGPAMRAADCEAWFRTEELSVMGLAEVLRHLPRLAALKRDVTARLLASRPAVFVGIDAPDFNLGLERQLKARAIPTIHYVGPSVWAWRRGRLRTIARAVSHMPVLFPFEPAHYRENGIPVTYVGHPLGDDFPLDPDLAGTRERLGLGEDAPGSRCCRAARPEINL